ncbi:NlpC/P60 family protein [Nitrosomonas sp.]|uniref:NlpC/P60 family protein n=1 Tax=Nitrosomonas sp. TaxID=42353 RepID=UPI001D40AB63|nr:NlpC/P60 family protein [Nitrosomonas sp.]MBX3617003.1 C40 family peptidase [Nitrosomonas sp.]
MKRFISQLIILIVICFLASCGTIQEKPAVKSGPVINKPANFNHIKKALYSQYNEWQGVRYQRGGLSRRGVDCSGFVHITYKSKLGMHLPRTTHLQSRIGKEIRKEDLRAGDLIFFRTGPASNHVGIYLENNKFLHASQKKGVIISRLDHVYWKANYWKSIRI